MTDGPAEAGGDIDLADGGGDVDVAPAVGDEAADDHGPAPVATRVLRYLVTELVDDPHAVRIDTVDRRRGVLLEVRVGPGDMGRVIGRRGRTASQIRSVVRAAATRDGVEVDVDFAD